MSEQSWTISPELQSEKPGLWHEAPGWRNLTVAAVMLTASAIALPLSFPESPAVLKAGEPAQVVEQKPDLCRLSLPTVPGPPGYGTVLSFVDAATSMAQIRGIQAQVGGLIDPAYIDKPRIRAVLDNGDATHFYFVPEPLQVHVGDRVIVQGWYRNENLPCNYVPNIVIGNLGPAGGVAKALVPKQH
jgi:hypothetical protein